MFTKAILIQVVAILAIAPGNLAAPAPAPAADANVPAPTAPILWECLRGEYCGHWAGKPAVLSCYTGEVTGGQCLFGDVCKVFDANDGSHFLACGPPES